MDSASDDDLINALDKQVPHWRTGDRDAIVAKGRSIDSKLNARKLLQLRTKKLAQEESEKDSSEPAIRPNARRQSSTSQRSDQYYEGLRPNEFESLRTSLVEQLQRPRTEEDAIPVAKSVAEVGSALATATAQHGAWYIHPVQGEAAGDSDVPAEETPPLPSAAEVATVPAIDVPADYTPNLDRQLDLWREARGLYKIAQSLQWSSNDAELKKALDECNSALERINTAYEITYLPGEDDASRTILAKMQTAEPRYKDLKVHLENRIAAAAPKTPKTPTAPAPKTAAASPPVIASTLSGQRGAVLPLTPFRNLLSNVQV